MMDHKPRKWFATPRQISQMEEVFSWIHFLPKISDRRIIWLRAARTPWQEVCVELGICRTTANYKWKNAILRITKKLL